MHVHVHVHVHIVHPRHINPNLQCNNQKQVKIVISLILWSKHVKLSQMKTKQVIKTDKNRKNMKNSKSGFLGTSMRAHTRGMCAHPMCMRMHA